MLTGNQKARESSVASSPLGAEQGEAEMGQTENVPTSLHSQHAAECQPHHWCTEIFLIELLNLRYCSLISLRNKESFFFLHCYMFSTVQAREIPDILSKFPALHCRDELRFLYQNIKLTALFRNVIAKI